MKKYGKTVRKFITILIGFLFFLWIVSSLFRGCNYQKPEQDRWTLDVNGFYKDGNDLRIETTVREVYPKENISFAYPKDTIVYADLFYGYNGKMEIVPLLKDSQIVGLGAYTIRYLRFFSEYTDPKFKAINLRVDIKINDKVAKKGEVVEVPFE